MKRSVQLIIVAALATMLSGCGKYVTHFSAPLSINTKDKFVVVCQNSNLKLAVENALLNRGFFIKNMETELMFKSELNDQVSVENYTYLQSLIQAIKRGGKVKGTSKIFESIREWNNLKDELIRVEDYSKLIIKKAEAMKKVYEVFGIDFIIVVKSVNTSTYAARVVAVKDNRLIYTMYLNSDKKGVEELFPPVTSIPMTLVNVDSQNDRVDDQYYYIRFAAFMVDKMFAGRK